MMEHKCMACGAVYYNNEMRPEPCKCGSISFQSEYDEDTGGEEE